MKFVYPIDLTARIFVNAHMRVPNLFGAANAPFQENTMSAVTAIRSFLFVVSS